MKYKSITVFNNIRILFDLLVSEYLNNTLLNLCELICSFDSVGQCFDFMNFITENKNSHLHVVLNTEVCGTMAFKFWTFTF